MEGKGTLPPRGSQNKETFPKRPAHISFARTVSHAHMLMGPCGQASVPARAWGVETCASRGEGLMAELGGWAQPSRERRRMGSWRGDQVIGCRTLTALGDCI